MELGSSLMISLMAQFCEKERHKEVEFNTMLAGKLLVLGNVAGEALSAWLLEHSFYA